MRNERNFGNLYMTTLPRSGSTLFAQHTGEHSKIFHIGESMYWEMLNPQDETCSCGKKGCEFLQNIADEIGNKHLALPLLKTWQIIDRKYWPDKKTYSDSVIQEGDQVPEESTLEEWLSKCAPALESIIAMYRKHSSKEIFLDNTKLHHIARRLINNRPNWGAIALVRDPRGIMSSFKNAGIRKGDLRRADSVLPLCQDFAEFLLAENNNPQMTIIKYEDFCKDPQDVLTRVCEFVGVKFEEQMLNPINSSSTARGHVLKGNHLLKSSKLIQVQEDQSWQTNLTSEELASFYKNKYLMNLYTKLGYNFSK